MSAVAGAAIRYSDLIGNLRNLLQANLKNVGDNYAADVPQLLRYPNRHEETIGVQNGYTMYIYWDNDAALAVVPAATFQNDFDSFIAAQLLELNVHATDFIKTTLLVKFLTALYTYITTRVVRVFTPLSSDTAMFYIPSLSSGGIPTTNIIDLSSITLDTSTVDTIVQAVFNQASSGVRSYCATWQYGSRW